LSHTTNIAAQRIGKNFDDVLIPELSSNDHEEGTTPGRPSKRLTTGSMKHLSRRIETSTPWRFHSGGSTPQQGGKGIDSSRHTEGGEIEHTKLR
jgi:hypothetical protein